MPTLTNEVTGDLGYTDVRLVANRLYVSLNDGREIRIPIPQYEVSATRVHFIGNLLYLSLSDGRQISVPIDQIEWLDWLANATQEQRAAWSIEPSGFAIYWEELDDGIEVSHLLEMQPLTQNSQSIWQGREMSINR